MRYVVLVDGVGVALPVGRREAHALYDYACERYACAHVVLCAEDARTLHVLRETGLPFWRCAPHEHFSCLN